MINFLNSPNFGAAFMKMIKLAHGNLKTMTELFLYKYVMLFVAVFVKDSEGKHIHIVANLLPALQVDVCT